LNQQRKGDDLDAASDERMLPMAGFGSASGKLARKKAYLQFSDEDSPSTPLPPPTLFPKELLINAGIA
jgi:hypothetical protein